MNLTDSQQKLKTLQHRQAEIKKQLKPLLDEQFEQLKQLKKLKTLITELQTEFRNLNREEYLMKNRIELLEFAKTRKPKVFKNELIDLNDLGLNN